MINGVKWTRVEAGFYALRDDEDQPCAFVERESNTGKWRWWLSERVLDPGPLTAPRARTLSEAKQAAKDHYELAVSLPGIISSGVQRIMGERDKPVEVRAKESVEWIASWVRVEVSVLN